MALGGIGPLAVKQAADAEFLRNLQSGRTPPIVGASGGVVRVPGPTRVCCCGSTPKPTRGHDWVAAGNARPAICIAGCCCAPTSTASRRRS